MPFFRRNQQLVVIGTSARVLAFSAARAGLNPIAVDVFADNDTRKIASCITLPSLDQDRVLAVLFKLVVNNDRPSLVYGSGIDSRPGLVERLSKEFEVLGNLSSVLERINTPSKFFPLLDSLAIPYPEIRTRRPENPDSWLLKVPFTEGGEGVLLGSNDFPDDIECYYQRKIDGPSFSVLFLANRQMARVIGFNTQWPEGSYRSMPYRFSGIMNVAKITDRQRKQITEYATELVKSASLVGLVSLDFMIDNEECKVLELNPRPSVSMALYDDRFPAGLLVEHINSVNGLPIKLPCSKRIGVRGLEIVYAKRSCVVPRKMAWPDWSADRPSGGTIIKSGQPLCTVFAEAESDKAVRRLLGLRKQLIYQQHIRSCTTV